MNQERFVLNQRDNLVWPAETLDREGETLWADSQCLNSSVSSWAMWFAATAGRRIIDPEKEIIEAMQRHWAMKSETEYAMFAGSLGLSPASPAARALWSRRGRPTSTVGIYSAVRAMLRKYELDLQGIDPADDCSLSRWAAPGKPLVTRYEDGTPLILERSGDGAAEVRDVFLSFAPVLESYGGIVTCGSWTSGGHYTATLQILEDGLVQGDPYGIPSLTEPKYLDRNDTRLAMGYIHTIDWATAARKALTSRTMFLKGVVM